MVRVVVCDSHAAIQMALEAKILETDSFELVGKTSSVDELYDVLDREHADVLVLELTLPRGIGVDLIRDLRQRYRDLRIVVYTMYDEAIYAARAIRAGASGYVRKQESTESVVRAIDSAIRGDVYVSSQVSAQLSSDENGDPVVLHATNVLTDQEIAVFQLLGEGCSPDEISSRLSLPRKQVDDLQQQAVDKLALETRESLVQYASKIVHQ